MSQTEQIIEINKDDLKNLIKDYIEIKVELKKANDAVKELKAEKKQVEDQLFDIMTQNELPPLDIGEEQIFAEVKELKKGVNKKHILAKINEVVQDEKIAELCVQKIYAEREITEKNVLACKKKRGRKKKN